MAHEERAVETDEASALRGEEPRRRSTRRAPVHGATVNRSAAASGGLPIPVPSGPVPTSKPVLFRGNE
ncbi:hypothetical protein E2562_011922 [Oryza meyeriana var. granulata]|uniref:Uncharacterized protein n=1 Tax=Oryza meyeriana var. granulata TaxID=110450 RepID=A0A6G1CFA3_9ORYZ|nr:hypothetical protein E2562_011922 [Oryza meyeriana var. granulata]